MAVPLFTLLALLARSATSVLIRPSMWLLLLGWFAVSHFDVGVFATELENSIAELWWLLLLILLLAICNAAIKGHNRNRGHR